MGVLRVENVSKSYFSRTILDNLSFTLEAGQHLALIGENGCGKTTLMRILAGCEQADQGSVYLSNGQVVSYLSQQMEEFTDLSAKVLSADHLDEISQRMQEITLALAERPSEHPDLLYEYQALTEEFERMGGYQYLPRLAQALAKLGISGETLDREIASLSGGERMRVLMARRLLENADILLLDEPTNHLDLDGLEWLEDFLRNFKGAFILISHDRYFIDRVADTTAELQAHKLTFYKGGYTDFLEQKSKTQAFQKLTLEKLQAEYEHQLEVKQTFLSHRNISGYHAREKLVGKLEDQIAQVKQGMAPSEKQMNFHFIPKADKRDADRVLLALTDAAMAWDNQPPLFEHAGLEIKASDKKVLVGPNGCGKSTLLAMLMGKIQNFPGDLQVASGLRFGHLGQYAQFPDESKTTLEELQDRTLLLEGEARSLLARYGFRDVDIIKPIEVLSGGEKSRLYLCCLLEEEPDLLFLDEPTNHLDIHSREVLEEAIIDFNGAVVAVSHDRYFIEHCNFEIQGFVQGNLRPYDSYPSYRHFAHLAQSDTDKKEKEIKVPLSSGQVLTSTPAALPEAKINYGKLRKELKQLRQVFQSLEVKIAQEEENLQVLEQALDTGSPESYQRYADAQAALEQDYEDFFKVGQKLEDITKQLPD